MKKKMILIIMFAVAVIGIGTYFLVIKVTPKPFVIIQAERTISIGALNSVGQRDFVMSPAKILINKMKLGSSITIQVKIINGEGDTIYTVAEEDPAKFDDGYFNADGIKDYSFSWDKSTIDIKSNTTDVVNITVKKLVKKATSMLEKGIAVSQQAGSGLSIVRSYVFEILIK
jgi:hypothetical protein